MRIGKIPPDVEPRWVGLHEAVAMHDAVVKVYGASAGFPHPHYLDSALHAPRQTLHYSDGGCDLYDLAAVYLFHIAKGHAFVDGNKRTAYLTALYFLHLNGIALGLPKNMLALAEATEKAAKNEMDKEGLAATMRAMPLMNIMDFLPPAPRVKPGRRVGKRSRSSAAASRVKRKGSRKGKKRFF